MFAGYLEQSSTVCLEAREDDMYFPKSDLSVSTTDSGAEDNGSLLESLYALSRPKDTLLILDWDDTLLPTAWCNMQGLRPEPGVHSTIVERAALSAEKLLSNAKALGADVVVITNAEQGWVEQTIRYLMPGLSDAMEMIQVVSARTEFEHHVGPDPTRWKCAAFKRHIDSWLRSRRQWSDISKKELPVPHVMSIGDSLHERDAIHEAIEEISHMNTFVAKSLKFLERPTIDQIVRQHELLLKKLEALLMHPHYFDLAIRDDELDI